MSAIKPISCRKGSTLRVLCVVRISTEKQDQRSLQDQEALVRSWLDKNVKMPYEIRLIAGIGSGERIDRKEFKELEEAIESEQFDLVVMEDLGRASRRVHSILLCELCIDHRTRLITVNDGIDTANDNWRVIATFASTHHELHNQDTSNRIRRTHRNRFTQGGVIRVLPYGFLRPQGSKLDADIQVIPEARKIYDEIFTRLEFGATYAEIADWLQENNIPTGDHVKSKRWTGHLVKSVVHNPILMGLRQHNVRMSIRDNRTGRRKTRLAPPEELLQRECPNLVIIEKKRWLRVTALLRERAVPRVRAQKYGPLSLSKPTKRADWPGRTARCGVCGRNLHVATKYGDNAKMVCSGAIDYKCWLTIECPRETLGRKLIETLLLEIEKIPDYDETLQAKVRSQLQDQKSEKQKQLKHVLQNVGDNQRRIDRITDAIAESGTGIEALVVKLRELESQKTLLLCEQSRIQAIPDDLPDLLPPMVELKQKARDRVNSLVFNDPEFGRFMNILIPNIHIVPYQMFQLNTKVLRCHAVFNLTGLLGHFPLTAIGSVAEIKVVIDIFEKPLFLRLQSVVHRMREEGMIFMDIGKELKASMQTVHFAYQYMINCQNAGITDPYQLMTEPEKTPRHRNSRHTHSRYRFEPLPGFPIWQKT